MLEPSTKRGWLMNPLVSIALFLFVAIILGAITVISEIYAIYAMLCLLSVVAATAGSTLFDRDAAKASSAILIYVVLVVPFFVSLYLYDFVYRDMSKPETYIDVNWTTAPFVAAVFIIVVLMIAFLVDNMLLGSPIIKTLQLTKRFLNARKRRYSVSLFSVTVLVASVVSLSYVVPSYTLLVLFLIVICQVAINMIGHVYERRSEIFSLATVGMNPDQLAGLSFAEAFIVGFVGGGIGYAVGLYILIFAALPITVLEVMTSWAIAMILFAVSASIVSTIIPAMKASMLATPSLLKRWWIEAPPPPSIGQLSIWTFQIPVKITEDNAEKFVNYFLRYARMLERFPYGSVERAENVQLVRPEDSKGNEVWELRFKYIYNEGGSPMIVTENELGILRNSISEVLPVEFTIRVIEFQHVSNIYVYMERFASNYRKMALEQNFMDILYL